MTRHGIRTRGTADRPPRDSSKRLGPLVRRSILTGRVAGRHLRNLSMRDLSRLRRRIRTGLAAMALGGVAGLWDVETAVFAGWLVVLAVLSWHDLRTRRLPTAIVNPATVLGIAALAATAWRTGEAARLGVAAATAAAAYAAFAALHALNPDGLGYGDVRLSGLLGLFLGWLGPDAMLAGTAFGAVGAAIVALTMLARRRGTRATLAFGPFLAAGAAAAALLHPASPLGLG